MTTTCEEDECLNVPIRLDVAQHGYVMRIAELSGIDPSQIVAVILAMHIAREGAQ